MPGSMPGGGGMTLPLAWLGGWRERRCCWGGASQAAKTSAMPATAPANAMRLPNLIERQRAPIAMVAKA